MPPVVDGQHALGRPGGVLRPHPGDPVGAAVLHLQNVGHGVLSPVVAGLQLDGATARGLGAVVQRGLLKAEGVHAQDGVVVGHAFGPGGQGAGDPVAQVAAVAQQEVHELARLQRQDIARELDGDVLQDAAGGADLPGQKAADGRDMALLPPGRRQVPREGEGLSPHSGGLGAAAQERHVGLQHMGHDKAGTVGDRRIQRRKGLAGIAVVSMGRLPVCIC